MDFYKERSNVVIRFHRIMFRFLFFLFFVSYAFAESDVIWLSDDVYLKKSSFKDLKGWEKENYKEAIDIFLKDCKRIEELPENYNIFPQYKKQHITKEDFFAVCKIASIVKDYNNKYLRIFFENYFMPYKVIDINNKLFKNYKKEINYLQKNNPLKIYDIKISDYSLTNVDEFMAEGFARAMLEKTGEIAKDLAYNSEKMSPYAIKILDLINKYYKK